MKCKLNISSAEYIGRPKAKTEKQKIAQLANQLKGIDVFKSIVSYQEYGKKELKTGDIYGNIAHLIKSRKGLFTFFSADSSVPYIKISASAFKSYFNLVLDVENENNVKASISLLKQSLEQLYNATKTELDLGLVTSISTPDIEYVHPKPYKFWRFYDKYAWVDIVNPKKLDDELADMKRITETLVSGSLPNGVMRSTINDSIYIIDWSPLLKSNGYNKLLQFRAKWFQENSDFIVDSSYNNDGDSRFIVVARETHPYFTYVDKFNGNVFKGIVLPKSQDDLNSLLQGILSHKDPDMSLFLIVPDRSSALKLVSKTKDADFAGVLYPDDEGELWLLNKQ